MRGLLLTAAVVLSLLQANHAFASDLFGNEVNVCNKGDTDLFYLVFATDRSMFFGDSAEISAWHKVEPGDCSDVSLSGYPTVALGFLQNNAHGVQGNPVYELDNATDVGSTDWAPATVCAPVDGTLSDDGGLQPLRERYTPPCREGFAPLRMSFGVIPNGLAPVFNLTPRDNTPLVAWPFFRSGPNPPVSKPAPQSGSTTSDLENLAKIIQGAAQGLEKGRIRKLAGSCEKSSLVMLFAFTKETPAQACNCIATRTIREEPAPRVNQMLADVDAGRDFDTVYGRVPEANFEKYVEGCATTR